MLHALAPPLPPAPLTPTAARAGRKRSTQLGTAALVTGLAGLTAYVYVRDPMEATVFPPCPFNVVTGGYCPGCGATRASFLILKGDVAGALQHNALWMLLLPVVLWHLAAMVAWTFLGRRIPRLTMTKGLATVLVGAFVVFFAVRNLPLSPFELLRPPGGGA